VVKIS